MLETIAIIMVVLWLLGIVTSRTIKGVGSLFLDGIAVFSAEDPHAAPSTPRCWRPRLTRPEPPRRDDCL